MPCHGVGPSSLGQRWGGRGMESITQVNAPVMVHLSPAPPAAGRPGPGAAGRFPERQGKIRLPERDWGAERARG